MPLTFSRCCSRFLNPGWSLSALSSPCWDSGALEDVLEKFKLACEGNLDISSALCEPSNNPNISLDCFNSWDSGFWDCGGPSTPNGSNFLYCPTTQFFIFTTTVNVSALLYIGSTKVRPFCNFAYAFIFFACFSATSINFVKFSEIFSENSLKLDARCWASFTLPSRSLDILPSVALATALAMSCSCTSSI